MKISRKQFRLKIRRYIASWTAEEAWNFYVEMQHLKRRPWYRDYSEKLLVSNGDYNRWMEKYHPQLKEQWNVRKWYL